MCVPSSIIECHRSGGGGAAAAKRVTSLALSGSVASPTSI